MLKAEKHEKIKMLAGAKLNTINDHIAKALKDFRRRVFVYTEQECKVRADEGRDTIQDQSGN